MRDTMTKKKNQLETIAEKLVKLPPEVMDNIMGQIEGASKLYDAFMKKSEGVA